MIEEARLFIDLIVQGFVRLLPYVLVTVPLEVVINLSGAAKHIRRVFSVRPIPAIVLATVVGAFSPFCSCGVIPVIASLLIGGVPLAPVMSFWLASPSMDPEIFFLSVATLGWDLALWRLLSTFILSLSAGLITHMAVQQGWISGPILRSQIAEPRPASVSLWRLASQWYRTAPVLAPTAFGDQLCCDGPLREASETRHGLITNRVHSDWTQFPATRSSSNLCETGTGCSESQSGPMTIQPSFGHRLLREGGSAAMMVGKFMLLALFLEALFTLYVPREFVVAIVGHSSRFAIFTAALVGVPLYTSNLTALPMIGALLAQGMNPSAALAFLIAGPTTTIPAMAAVWGLVRRRVFGLYVAFAFFGAVLSGFLHHFATVLQG